MVALLAAAASGMGEQPPPATIPPGQASKKRLLAKTEECAEVVAWIDGVIRARGSQARGAEGIDNLSSLNLPREIATGDLRPGDLDCAGVPPLKASTHFAFTKIFYDRVLHSWEFQVRCARTTDCVPFLVRWPQPARDSAQSSSVALLKPPAEIHSQAGPHFLLRAGETVTLLWDQEGIRVVLPVICLEKGNVGDSIRVRIQSGTRVLRAVIVNQSLLRVVL